MQTGVPPQLPQLHQGVCQWGGWAAMADQLKDDPGSPRLLVIGQFDVLIQGATQGEQVLAWLQTPWQLELSPKLVLAA